MNLPKLRGSNPFMGIARAGSALLLAVAAAAAAWLSIPDPEPSEAATSTTSTDQADRADRTGGAGSEIAALRADLRATQTRQDELARKLEQVEALLAGPREEERQAEAMRARPNAGRFADMGERVVRMEFFDEAPEPEATPGPDRLEASGFDAGTRAGIRMALEEMELQELYLENQARREGWSRAELRDARREGWRQLRERVGDDRYDLMLWASGRPNRVRVESVMAGSAAAAAGIREGDTLIRYADERLFSVRGLQGLTAEGDLGESVRIDLERDGERISTTAPRGPLGVRVDGRNEPPTGVNEVPGASTVGSGLFGPP